MNFGPEDEFVNVLARLVRLSPVIYPLPGGGAARFQPVGVDDIARAIGGLLFLIGAVVGCYNIWMTIRTAPQSAGEPVSDKPDSVLVGTPALQPGE